MKKEKQLLILFLTVIAGVFISCKDDEETSYSLSDLKMEFYLVNEDGEVDACAVETFGEDGKLVL